MHDREMPTTQGNASGLTCQGATGMSVCLGGLWESDSQLSIELLLIDGP